MFNVRAFAVEPFVSLVMSGVSDTR